MRVFSVFIAVFVIFISLGATTVIAQQLPQDAELKALCENSSLVVLGRVTSVIPAPFDRDGTTEHNPNWHVATVEVTRTLKGDKRKQVVVVFPASRDVAWDKSPKFSVGQVAVFILDDFKPLHPTRFSIRAGIYYSALSSLQVQPRSNLKKVKHLLHSR